VTLEIGADNRCRFEPRPFKTITGRFAPKGSPYAPAAWTRVFMVPDSGSVLLEFDWVVQEAEIFARRSQDPAMQKACKSGDLPLWLANENSAIPSGAAKAETKTIRNLYKIIFYTNTYGAGIKKIAAQLKISPSEAGAIKNKTNTTFRVGYAWLRRTRDAAFQRGQIETPLGTWSMRVPGATKVTSIQNWPIQASGAEMLRRALVLADAAGISILCPIHDAILIEAPADAKEAAIAAVTQAMNQASREVLDGHTIPIKGKRTEG
jgi:DNA polymerase-1